MKHFANKIERRKQADHEKPLLRTTFCLHRECELSPRPLMLRKKLSAPFLSCRRFASTKLIERNNPTDDAQHPIHAVQKSTSNNELLSTHSCHVSSYYPSTPVPFSSPRAWAQQMTGSAASCVAAIRPTSNCPQDQAGLSRMKKTAGSLKKLTLPKPKE